MNHLQYFNDLDDLEDIIESIFEESDDSDTYNGDDIANEHIALFSEKEQSDIIESSLEMMYEYINDNPRAISLPTFHEDMIDTIFELILISSNRPSRLLISPRPITLMVKIPSHKVLSTRTPCW